jgi:para-nitrobenzyl esterase
MKFALAALALAAAVPASACAQAAAPKWPLAIASISAPAGAKLDVSSPSFAAGGPIAIVNTQYGANRFPGLAWQGAPPATKTFAVIMQDTDPPAPYADLGTILHWTEFNIPGQVTRISPGQSAVAAGAAFGANMTGKAAPYAGPHPPAGGPVHHYHFQVFALDTALPLKPGAQLAAIVAAMKGHVLASGEIVGTYQGPPQAS